MTALFYAIISGLIVSLIGLVVFLLLLWQENFSRKIIFYLVSFSAGAMIGGAFFHLLPEAIAEQQNSLKVFAYLLVGFCVFFILEKFLRWHHCHDKNCHDNSHLGYMNLIGDGIHNFIDGLIIISAFMVNTALGIVTTISIISHEIPQEMGDFGVLLYSGMKKTKMLGYNFLVALLAVLGVVMGYLLINSVAGLNNLLLPAAAGGFIYIAATDLIPELQKEIKAKSSFYHFFVFILALLFMLLIKIIGG
ncbi:MAG: ZIP family metal transporter [Candidatus Parcubacteria bacterium]|nr:ZIP family metal transporter [Candidatus Parcubacteria bacterium]